MSGRARNCDCAVVGAGPVGALLACIFARSGRSVVLAERGVLKTDIARNLDTRGYALSAGSVTLLQDLGYWPALQPFAEPITEIRVSREGGFGGVRMDAAGEGVPALGQVVPAARIDALLAQALHDAGVRVLERARLLELGSPGGERRQVSFELADGVERLAARLVCAADGVRSSTRNAAGIEVLRHRYGADALVFDVRPVRPHMGRAFERFTSEGPLALLPEPGGLMNVVWVAPPDVCAQRESMSEAMRIVELQRRFGWRLGKLEAAGPLARFPLERVRARRMVAERFALVGNAAHAVHPVAGQGLNLSLRDVAALAQRVLNSGDPGAPDLLADYAQARTPDIDRVASATDFLARGLLAGGDLMPQVVGGAMVFLDRIAPLRRQVAAFAMGLDALPRWSLGTLPSAGADGRGAPAHGKRVGRMG